MLPARYWSEAVKGSENGYSWAPCGSGKEKGVLT
jgi:hypothetical protein